MIGEIVVNSERLLANWQEPLLLCRDRGACFRMQMNAAADFGPGGMDRAVNGKTSLVVHAGLVAG